MSGWLFKSDRAIHHYHHRRYVERARHHRYSDLIAGGRGAASDRRRVHLRGVAAGIIGTGMLAVPVLAGSAAYALGEAFGWSVGLARLPLDAKAFYGTVAVATLVGVFINFVDIDPIKALFWSAVINGVVAVPLMVVMMLMTMRPKVMGAFTLPQPLRVMGWPSTDTMAVSVTIMFVTW
jgi:Mn2+/Fe2+ NRAMP family transporter